MAGRREKLRRVGIIPEYRGFTPDGLASGDAIDMTVDELEALRLCHYPNYDERTGANRTRITVIDKAMDDLLPQIPVSAYTMEKIMNKKPKRIRHGK